MTLNGGSGAKTNAQLKDLLKLRGLPVSGKKSDLIARLKLILPEKSRRRIFL